MQAQGGAPCVPALAAAGELSAAAAIGQAWHHWPAAPAPAAVVLRVDAAARVPARQPPGSETGVASGCRGKGVDSPPGGSCGSLQSCGLPDGAVARALPSIPHLLLHQLDRRAAQPAAVGDCHHRVLNCGGLTPAADSPAGADACCRRVAAAAGSPPARNADPAAPSGRNRLREPARSGKVAIPVCKYAYSVACDVTLILCSHSPDECCLLPAAPCR
jgi:hypothetical protein